MTNDTPTIGPIGNDYTIMPTKRAEALNALVPLAARILELEAENKRLREGLFWIAEIGFVQEKHAKQHADDCCKLARETLGYQEQAALKGGEI